MRDRLSLSPAAASDFESLLALRIRAMRASLERLGRFDPARARERFAHSFAPEHTRHIMLDGAPIGFVALRPKASGLMLDHLYVDPDYQGRGIGTWVMRRVLEQSDRAGAQIEVGALKESESNRFYRRHGFVKIGEGEWDNHYLRLPVDPGVDRSPQQLVRAFWDAIQARHWEAARALLADEASATWWTSGERFHDADAIIKVNAIYPEGWTVHVLEVSALQDGRVLSIVRVDQAPHSFFATSLFRVQDALIRGIDEYWSTFEAPPAWRTPEAIGGYSRFDPRCGSTKTAHTT